MDLRPFRVHYLDGQGQAHDEDVLAVRFDLWGLVSLLRPGWDQWSRVLHAEEHQFRGSGTLAPYVEVLDYDDAIEARFDGRGDLDGIPLARPELSDFPVAGQAKVFAFHRFSSSRVDLVRGEDGSTAAFLNERGWQAEGSKESFAKIEFSVVTVGLPAFVPSGPRTRVSGLAERELALMR